MKPDISYSFFEGFLFQVFIKSKNFPDYSVKYQSGTTVQLGKGNYLLWMYKPGYFGNKETFSFQTFNGRWLKEESNSVIAQPRPYYRSYEYFKSIAFWIRPNKFHTGYVAFESWMDPGHYIRHSSNSLLIASDDGSSNFMSDASWIVRESGW